MSFSRASLASSCALLVAVLPAASSKTAGFFSRYTHHDYSTCAARPSPEPNVIEVRACEGVAGIDVIWTGEPDASSVDFGKAGDDADLGLGLFHEVDGVVEWRGPSVAGAIAPLAAIVRYRRGRSIGKLDGSRLIVYRVAAGQASCVMAIVSGVGANATARAIVDRHAAHFVCGKSARLTRP